MSHPQRSAMSDLREYVKSVLWSDSAVPISYRLPVTTATPPFTDADIYDTRLSGADRREALAALSDRPLEDAGAGTYEYRGQMEPGLPQTCIVIGASEGDPTSAAASSAPANRVMLSRLPATRDHQRVVPREIVRGVASSLCPDDQQALRSMARLGKAETRQGKHGVVTVTVTVKYLATEAGVRRETIHRRQHDAARALLAGLYQWHEQHPERQVA